MEYKGTYDLEQDEWSSQELKFPTRRGGFLRPKGIFGRDKWGTKKYVVECDICGKMYTCTKQFVVNGGMPCLCSKSSRLTRETLIEDAKREASKQGVEIIKIEWAPKSARHKILLRCKMHGEYRTGLNILRGGSRCPQCAQVFKVKKPKPVLHKNSPSQYKFHSTEGRYVLITCDKCSKDKFVKGGVCTGIFRTTRANLSYGVVCCRCSPSPRLSVEQKTYNLLTEGAFEKYPFVKTSGPNNSSLCFVRHCRKHGDFETRYDIILKQKSICPLCAGRVQRQSYIHTVFDGDVPVALKIGIAKETSVRLYRQNKINLFRMENVGVWVFDDVSHCKAAEKQCKKELECKVLTKRELSDGWTETTHIKNLDRIIEIYENHGGKRINTNEER